MTGFTHHFNGARQPEIRILSSKMLVHCWMSARIWRRNEKIHLNSQRNQPTFYHGLPFETTQRNVRDSPEKRADLVTRQLPKVVRSSSVLSILTWKCASRHNGVQFFISPLASWLRTRRFSEPTFRPSGATNHWKNSVSRLSYLFAHLHLLSSDLFSSDSSHLCFSTVHIV